MSQRGSRAELARERQPKAAAAAAKKARGPARAGAADPAERSQLGAGAQLEAEAVTQFTMKMRAAQHRQLSVLAFQAGMTMRGFVMNALKAQGLDVSDTDLVDRRRR